jgi:hypothetical protein
MKKKTEIKKEKCYCPIEKLEKMSQSAQKGKEDHFVYWCEYHQEFVTRRPK